MKRFICWLIGHDSYMQRDGLGFPVGTACLRCGADLEEVAE